MNIVFFVAIIAYLLVPSLRFSVADDSIALSQTLRDGKSLVSKGGTFELGFFTPGNSNRRYLGIWYKNISVQTVVWVANRLNPINDSSGILALNSSGHLLLTQNDTVVWYTRPLRQAQNPVAQLLDSGNLVVKEEIKEANPETVSYLWQSFDYPSDTMLPGMKFGWDLRIGLNRNLTAWKSWDDPAPGDFSVVMLLNNYPDTYLMKGNQKVHRFGPWNGLHSSGSPDVKPNQVYSYRFVENKNEIYYTYNLKNDSILTTLVLNQTTSSRYRYVWSEATNEWMIYTKIPGDYCDNYGLCGANGNCIITESPVCQCLKGFRPRFPQQWNSVDWSQGCVHNKPLICEDKHKDGFIKLSGLKVPDTTQTWVDKTIGLDQCREKCLNNCTCMAYTNSDIRGEGSGCVLWFGGLIDIRQFPVGGQDLYVRLLASELEVEHVSKKTLPLIVITTTSIVVILGMIFVGSYYIYKVGRNLKEKQNIKADENNGDSEDDLDLPLLELSTIINATDNFSSMNKIGEGGFGPVYKGRLEDGQEIAVKKLSNKSTQGMSEFKNEVKLIAKLQHRNLVKLLGCCIQGQEKMVVYEYMPYNSLDHFIFDCTRGKLLDWSKRFHIICGIARGLLYLHQDSRLRIIHRDLKASNILLDEKLNPKISDFGLAKTFGGDQIEGNTNRVVGTYGYMAPEYAVDGLYSTKSDVFSFGIVLLEIIYGRRNKGFHYPNHSLISHAWMLWKEGKALELIDTNIKDSCIVSEVLRCIHVSLLCVEHHPRNRPTMSSVVLMLTSGNELADPKQPGYFSNKVSDEINFSPRLLLPDSINEMSISQLEPR